MTLFRPLKWIAALVLALVVLIALVVVLVDWNWLRGPIAHRVSSATGRTFAINGDLSVDLSLQPRIIANDIVLGNAPWAREPTMFTLKRLDFTIDLWKLLSGTLEFPAVVLSEPRFALEIGADGRPNWVFNEADSTPGLTFPSIHALAIDHGRATYRDLTTKTDLAFEVVTRAAGKENAEDSLEISGKGRVRDLPASFKARGGALLSLRHADRPYPIKGSAVIASTKASVDGVLLNPLRLKGERLNFTLEGSDLALLFPIIGVPIPPTPPYQLTGFLNHADDQWSFDHFKGVVGRSDLSGKFTVDRRTRPQMITANLVSQKLDMQDFGGFIGADRGTTPSRIPPPSDRVLPAEPFSLEKLQAANADVYFRGERILIEKMPLEKMNAHLVVSDGQLRLAPLEFRVAGGSLVSQIEMDGRQARIVTKADITAKGLQLAQMFPTSRLAGANTGTMGGRARLDGKGNSVAQMLGTANGEAALIMDSGSVSELMLRLSNLDIANSLRLLLGGDQQVPIHCVVGNFKAVDGNFKVESLLVDTPKVNITGSGDVDFSDESLRLRLVSQSKGFSLVSLRGPIAVGGSFKSPLVRPEVGGALARGSLAVALGAVTAGIGTLIPLLDFGQEQESNCTALMNQAKSDAGVKSSDLKPLPRK